ncbi:Protein phosphatase PTC7 [Lunasporangiospora selenospora]|uniref:Protein phosphatase n=1 Tax=Lunasporangiospora selenospora TaxID=979761 RepID=A0A9P6KG30_9FUNG|nr:Protein phosphatase PTC7 [Lunasporangiospora selenospora]
MLGRPASRPLGITPARLLHTTTAVSQRLLNWYWITANPSSAAAFLYMQRYLNYAPQLLITNGTPASLFSASSASSPSPSSMASATACIDSACCVNAPLSCTNTSISTSTSTSGNASPMILTPTPTLLSLDASSNNSHVHISPLLSPSISSSTLASPTTSKVSLNPTQTPQTLTQAQLQQLHLQSLPQDIYFDPTGTNGLLLHPQYQHYPQQPQLSYQQQQHLPQNVVTTEDILGDAAAAVSSVAVSPPSSPSLVATPSRSPSPAPMIGTTELDLEKTHISYNYLLAASWHPKARRRLPVPRIVASHADGPYENMTSGSGVESTGASPGFRTGTSTSSGTGAGSLSKGRGVNQGQVKNEITKTATGRSYGWKEKLRGKVDAGEDAFFHVSTSRRVALGVADGVGGWSELGVDPALFSWALMNNAENVARDDDKDDRKDEDNEQSMEANQDQQGIAVQDKKSPDAQSILDRAYSRLVQSGKIEAGSSTACILSLCKHTGQLFASSLGDSAFLLIRDNKCIYESPSQQHFWNCPYQLTILPPSIRNNNDNKPTQPRKYIQDFPKDAVQTTQQLEDGDVIVLATDGFWDNVFTKEALELVDRELGDIIRYRHRCHLQQSQCKESQLDDQLLEDPSLTSEEILARVRALSQRLTNTARRFSMDSKRRTPFSQGAKHLRCGG